MSENFSSSLRVADAASWSLWKNLNHKKTAMLKTRNKAAATAKKADTLTLDNPNILIFLNKPYPSGARGDVHQWVKPYGRFTYQPISHCGDSIAK